MKNSAQVITPKVSCSVGGTEIPASRVTMTLQAGGVSTCTVHGQVKPNLASGVVDMLDEVIATKIGALQSRVFTMRSEPDSSVRIDDGQGGSITFQGYFSSPSYSNAPGNMGIGYTMIHESAILSAYRGFIYAASNTDNETQIGGGIWGALTGKNTATILGAVLSKLITRWERTFDATITKPEDREIITAQHTENEKIKPLLLEVLAQSSVEFENIPELPLQDHIKIQEWMADNVILQRGSSFFDNLSTYEQGFQALLIPSFTPGELGKFISQRRVMDYATKLQIPAVDVTYSGGDRKMLPISNVVIMNHMGPGLRSQQQVKQSNSEEMRIYAYPNRPLTGGDLLYDSGPPWLSSIQLSSDGIDASQGAVTAASLGTGLDLGKYKSSRASLNKFLVDTADVKHMPIIRQWAKNLYSFAALEGSTATVGIPLCVPMTPGARYDVVDLGGRPLFSGFLQQVSHTVSLDSKPPSAGTFLSFSHIEAGGFTLPA